MSQITERAPSGPLALVWDRDLGDPLQSLTARFVMRPMADLLEATEIPIHYENGTHYCLDLTEPELRYVIGLLRQALGGVAR